MKLANRFSCLSISIFVKFGIAVVPFHFLKDFGT